MALLQGLVGRRRLYEWSLTGEPLTAARVLDAGLLNYVVPRATEEARENNLINSVS
jgi:enoyl-CoA hydratase/carnithine racemase